MSEHRLGRGVSSHFQGEARHRAPRRQQIESTDRRRHHRQHGGCHHRSGPPSSTAPGADGERHRAHPEDESGTGHEGLEGRPGRERRSLRACQLLPRVDIRGGEDRAHESAAVARGDERETRRDGSKEREMHEGGPAAGGGVLDPPAGGEQSHRRVRGQRVVRQLER